MAPSAYSIGKQQKKPSFIKDNKFPGVGAYQNQKQSFYTSRDKKGPLYSIGKTARLKTQKLCTSNVGPNSYDLTRTSLFNDRKRGFSMISKKNQRIVSEGPGPGSYEGSPKNFRTKYYSFGIKTQKNSPNKDIKPGPGDYNLDKRQKSSSVSFQLSERPDLIKNKKNLPGPGNYEVKQIGKNHNKFTFTKTHKFYEEITQQKKKKQIPGPADYRTNINILKKKVASQKFTINKRQLYTNNQNPGPSAYTTSNTPYRRSPVATIGNSPKNSPSKEKSPGPANYQTSGIGSLKQKHPSIIFNKADRHQKIKNNSPGPGQYQIVDTKSSRYYSMSGRNSLQKKQISPDPASYDINYNSIYPSPQNSVIGKSKKFLETKKDTPGPNLYHVEPKFKAKTFYFPKQKRQHEEKITTPGPGAYDISIDK